MKLKSSTSSNLRQKSNAVFIRNLARDFPTLLINCLPLNSVPGNNLKLKSVFPRKPDLCSAHTCTRTHALTHTQLCCYIHNWRCHNSQLPHITHCGCVSAEGFMSFRVCVLVCVWVRGNVKETEGEKREIKMTNSMAEKKGFDGMWADSQGTNCATKEVMHGNACQAELHTLESNTLTEVTLRGRVFAQHKSICTRQYMHGRRMCTWTGVVHRHNRISHTSLSVRTDSTYCRGAGLSVMSLFKLWPCVTLLRHQSNSYIYALSPSYIQTFWALNLADLNVCWISYYKFLYTWMYRHLSRDHRNCEENLKTWGFWGKSLNNVTFT